MSTPSNSCFPFLVIGRPLLPYVLSLWLASSYWICNRKMRGNLKLVSLNNILFIVITALCILRDKILNRMCFHFQGNFYKCVGKILSLNGKPIKFLSYKDVYPHFFVDLRSDLEWPLCLLLSPISWKLFVCLAFLD